MTIVNGTIAPTNPKCSWLAVRSPAAVRRANVNDTVSQFSVRCDIQRSPRRQGAEEGGHTRTCRRVRSQTACSLEFCDTEQSVYCWKFATENKFTVLERCQRRYPPIAPYQVPGSASACWQVRDDPAHGVLMDVEPVLSGAQRIHSGGG